MNPSAEPASEVRPGCLYVVATPIGNLGDFSPRAQRVLAQVSRIAAEDTRTTGVLLSHFGIHTPLTALHEHNESAIADTLVGALQRGESLALVSDAGTPLVSDPGYVLVRAARDAGVEVVTIPGPCAAIAALSISGLASDSFVFAGFLPARSTARRERISALASEPRTLILYESSHRIADCAEDLASLLGERRVSLSRELTKRFEQSLTCAARELPAWLAADANRVRGEFVLVIEGAPESTAQTLDVDRLLRALLAELPASRAAKVAASLSGQRKGDLYARALEISGQAGDSE